MAVAAAPPDRFTEAAARLEELCAFTGTPQTFWSHLLPVMAGASLARMGALLQQAPAEPGRWEMLAFWPGRSAANGENEAFLEAVQPVAEAAAQAGLARSPGALAGEWVVGLRVPQEALEDEAPPAVLIFAGAG